MIRIFAPPTHDHTLRPDAVTAVNFLLHIAVFLALFIPFGGGVEKESLIDRLIVYLVPPADPGIRQVETGLAPRSDEGVESGLQSEGKSARGAPESITPNQVVPTLNSADLRIKDQPSQGDNALSVLEVDSAVVYDPTSAAPEYPAHLQSRGIEGFTSVRYVVDTTGLVDTMTYRVLTSSHADFAVAVRRALPGMHFRPALQSGQKVRQLVEQTFRFRIAIPSDTLVPRPGVKPPA
jgi:TonB family protein